MKKISGQSLAEFALIIPAFLLLVLGIVEFGRLFTIYSSVGSAAREAARFAVRTGGDTPHYKDCTGIRNAALNVATISGMKSSDITIQYEDGPGGSIIYASCVALAADSSETISNSNRVVVTISVEYKSLSGFGWIPEITISSTSRRTIVIGIEFGS